MAEDQEPIHTAQEDGDSVSPTEHDFVQGDPLTPGPRQWSDMSGGQKALGCGCLLFIVGFLFLVIFAIAGAIVRTDDDSPSPPTTTPEPSTTTSLPLSTTSPPTAITAPQTGPPTTAPPATEPPTTAAPAPSALTPTTAAASSGGGSVYYARCAEAKAAGAAPLYRGDAGYRAGLDGDNDGVACES